MWNDSKLLWLIGGAIFIAIFEILSFAGIKLPEMVALPFFSAFTLLFGYETLKHGFSSLIHLDFKSINALMLIAVAGAFYLGEYPEGAIVIILFTLAEKLEDIGIDKSKSALDSLLDKMPKMVQLKNGIETSVENIKVGDVILIKPFEMVALDGKVTDGVSYVDEAPITGEPLPIDKRTGDLVFAGTLNKQGRLEVEVLKTGADSTLSKIKELTFNALQNKSRTQEFIERFSSFYTPLILFLALFWVLFSFFILQKPFNEGLFQAIVLLVISCPCALVISTPISIFSAIGSASSSGSLIKGGKYLEFMGQIKAIALDKTRTLTLGEPTVTDIYPYGNTSKEELLACAAGIEAFSEHPLAESIFNYAKELKIDPHKVENFESIVGKGAKADCLVCDEKHHCIGKLAFILEHHHVPDDLIKLIDTLQDNGKTVMIMSSNKEVKGLIAVEDKIREDSSALIASLNRLGVEPVMLTGDHKKAAQAVAKRIGIKEVKADLLPEDKAKAVEDLVSRYGIVAMFGDGVNDAPALALSNVGISLSSLGSDTALEAASIILLNDRLSLIPYLIRLGRKTLTTIKFNTILAVGVKFLVVALALMGHANLALAILADVGVTIIVILISLRLMNFHHQSDPADNRVLSA